MTRLDLTPLASVRGQLDALADAGWSVEDGGGVIAITQPDADLRGLVEAAGPLRAAVLDLRFICPTSGGDLVLRMTPAGLEVDRLPDVAPTDFLEDRELRSDVEALWRREASAAFALPLRWRASGTLAIDRLLTAPAEVEVRVHLKAAAVIEMFANADLTQLHALSATAATRRVHVALDACGSVHTDALSFVGLEQGLVALPEPEAPSTHDLIDEVAGIPCVRDLRPTSHGESAASWPRLADDLFAAAALAAWCYIASEVDTTNWQLTFIGFKRLVVPLPANHRLPTAAAEAVLRLYDWIFADPSPDKLLATRRVASLYENDAVLASAADIRASAEIVFVGLRNDAVAEVLKASRDAEAQVLEVVRQTVKSTQDALKAATDRALAALVAIGGVLIANSSRVIEVSVARGLLVLVAAFLLLLALWSAFVEWPLIASPLKRVFDDVQVGTSLLSDAQRARLKKLGSVTETTSQLRRVRLAVPALYLVAATLIVIFGHPDKFR